MAESTTARALDADDEVETNLTGEAADANERMVLVKPVSNAIRILKYLVEAGGPTRSVTISRALGINASTCFNILRTPVVEEIVEFDPVAKTYKVGMGLTALIGELLTEGQRVAAAAPLMAEILSLIHI